MTCVCVCVCVCVRESRKGRSTIGHLSTLTTSTETRKLRNASTSRAFIDFKKAYAWVNRNLLFCKLDSLGLSSKIIKALYSLYYNVQSFVEINGNYTEWFDIKSGLKQDCILFPLLFNIFIINLVDEVKKLSVGVKLDNEKICALLYADDVVFLCENESELQKCLDVLSTWCNTNDLVVNLDKSKLVHFRTQSRIRTDFQFSLNGHSLEAVSQYKYYGLLLAEFLKYNDMAKAVAKSASRSLGLLIAKCKANGGFEFSTFSKLVEALVMSVIEYGASIWGKKDFSCINSVKK